ncbi:MAG: DNA polymerase III subunit alpha [Alphaproteobacteria bacterium]|nr:DNA polymerase III subunit alpha [Alphaproteobacteria bacterium]
MTHADFVHLRVHSAYSLSEGALKVEELTALAKTERMPAVAVTDRGNLFGALEFSQAATKSGLQPIIGCELPVTVPAAGDGQAKRGAALADTRDWIVLLARNQAGYGNLMRLSSALYLAEHGHAEPSLPLTTVEAHTEGLIALTGGPAGPIGRLLLAGNRNEARSLLKQLAEAFPGRLYVEIMRHGLESERRTEAEFVALADELELPLVATNDAYFGPRDMHAAHDALLCIADGTLVDEQNRRRLTPDHGFRSAKEMRALFADLPDALDNTLVIARRCAFKVSTRAPILPPFPTNDGLSEADLLRQRAEEGLEQRLAAEVFNSGMDDAAQAVAAKPYRDRLAYELDVIIAMKFPGYFLIVADFIGRAKADGIPVGPGRGSGAGSVVAWALQITDLDPLRFGLLFERFLNPERVSMPDFDIDFCQHHRDRVIEYVAERYGRERVAQIITFGKLQARAALRDVGRVLGLPYSQVDRLCKLVPNNPANPVTLAQAVEGEPQLQAARDTEPQVARLIDIALRLEGLYRNASTHAAGVVIGDRPLDQLVPLYRDPRASMMATQFSMKYVELAGLVKFDFLGLKTLTVLDEACRLIRAGGQEIDLAHLPLDDKRTFAMLGEGESAGVFQLESSGMRDVLRQMKPDSFEDIIALVALYRPGPMDNIPKYIACKHGLEQPDYLHPSLEGILKETFGVIIYQEQVMQIAQVLAGYSLGGADLLRRAMGKKIKAEMDAQEETFVTGAMKNGVSKVDAARIFELVARFAGYGFNKSHAAAYALVAYQTAFLKANHPVEFLAASMTLDMGDTDKLNLMRQELDRLGIKLLPPDVNRSEVHFSVERATEGKAAVRYALAAVRNVGVAATETIVAARSKDGPFTDVFEFAGRLDAKSVNKRQLENLVKAGALDAIEPNRRMLFESADLLVRHAVLAAESRESRQDSLFGGGGGGGGASSAIRPVMKQQADWLERMMMEYEAIGFYLSAHPLDGASTALGRLGVTALDQLGAAVERGLVRLRVAGVILSKQERGPAGQRFAFIRVSDPSGSQEVAIFRDVYAEARELIEPSKAVLITGNARIDGGAVKLTAQTVEDLTPRLAAQIMGLSIRLREPGPIAALDVAIKRASPGKGRLSVVVEQGDDEIAIALPRAVAISQALRTEIAAIPGVLGVVDE